MRRIDTSVVIVGAGLAGLVAARNLSRAGVDCLVLEASARVGGRVQSFTYSDGRTAEAHMEEFWEASPAYALLQELELELAEDCAHSGLIIDGRLCRYQGDGDRDTYLTGMFDGAERDAFVRWDHHARTQLDTLDSTHRVAEDAWARGLMSTPFSRYVKGHVGARRVAEWIRIVVESETAVEWDRISALDGLAEMRPFLDSPTGFGETNVHVVGGNERLVEALVAQLPAGTVATLEPVTSIRDLGDHVQIRHGPDGAASVTRCDQVIVTVPMWSLGAIHLDIELEAAARSGLETVASGSYVKALLRLRPEAAPLWDRHGPGVFTLLSDSAAGCIYLVDDTAGRDPLLTVLVHASHARHLCRLPADQRTTQICRSLDRLRGPDPLWPGLADLVREVRVFAYPQAVAYWPVRRGRSRYDARATALRRAQGRLHFASDTLDASHSDGAVRSAQRVAARLVGMMVGSGAPGPDSGALA